LAGIVQGQGGDSHTDLTRPDRRQPRASHACPERCLPSAPGQLVRKHRRPEAPPIRCCSWAWAEAACDIGRPWKPPSQNSAARCPGRVGIFSGRRGLPAVAAICRVRSVCESPPCPWTMPANGPASRLGGAGRVYPNHPAPPGKTRPSAGVARRRQGPSRFRVQQPQGLNCSTLPPR